MWRDAEETEQNVWKCNDYPQAHKQKQSSRSQKRLPNSGEQKSRRHKKTGRRLAQQAKQAAKTTLWPRGEQHEQRRRTQRCTRSRGSWKELHSSLPVATPQLQPPPSTGSYVVAACVPWPLFLSSISEWAICFSPSRKKGVEVRRVAIFSSALLQQYMTTGTL
jgi:hypothetical protein